MEYQIYTLSNGLRVIHKPDAMSVTYCGMVISAGSRDESEDEEGMAHFVEHLLFKGTQKRRSGHIINKLENVGGELNAFTSKEETVVYAVVLSEHLEKAVDLIGDIVFNSTFPAKELEKERIIILDEIQSYNDSPSELIYDEFEELIFDHPIGHNILGKPELLEKYTSDDTRDFVDRFYQPEEMVFFVLGNIDEKKLLRWAEKYLVAPRKEKTHKNRIAPSVYLPQSTTLKKDTFQVHYLMGNRAHDIYHPDRMAMYLLNNMLGGPGMNSLLNLSLREKHGLVYNVDSVYQPLTDTGMWTVYFGCDPGNFNKCEKLVKVELKKLREDKIKEQVLKKYKLQLLGQMAISMEQKENLAISLGKSLLRYGKVDSMDVIREYIHAVTADKMREVAQQVFDEKKLSALKYI
jgi:predicted Zn-dependent peptidase